MGCKCSKPTVDTLYKPVEICQFKLLKPIGKGTFGKVCLVEFMIDDNKYALKYTAKDTAVKDKAVHFILQERKILEGLDHPFICSLRFSFQDENFMYMILDYKEGSDLRKSMKNRKWSEDETRMVIAEISSALEYLHRKNIVHRDLKPDNILLDRYGHAFLSDFNIATTLKDTPLKAIAGTEPCKIIQDLLLDMAPELVASQGYLCSVDWWSLGVIMFEMVCGERPFRTKNRKELIKRGAFKFPSNVQLSDTIKDVICGFLRMDAHTRLGVGFEGMMALRKHPYFSKIIWLELKYKGSTPLFIPEIESEIQSNDNTKINEDFKDILGIMQKPITKRKPSKIMSGDLLKIYYGFDYFDHRVPRMQSENVVFEEAVDTESSNAVTRATGSGSSESGDWIIKAKSSTGSFRKASSFRNSSFSGSKIFSSLTPTAAVIPSATANYLLGLPNINPSSNSKTVEKLKRRHSISMVDSQRNMLHFNQGLVTPEGMTPNEILLEKQIAVMKPFPNSPIIDVTNPYIIEPRFVLDAQESIPLEEMGLKLIPDGIEVVDTPLPALISPISMSKSPNFRRRHSVSGTRPFSRQEYVPKFGPPSGIDSIEERKSVFLDKSIFLDKE